MPGINGLELVRQIHEFQPDLPCIVITGFGSAEASIEALRAGAYWYLEKPFEQERLDVVRRLVEHERDARGARVVGVLDELVQDAHAVGVELEVEPRDSLRRSRSTIARSKSCAAAWQRGEGKC